MQNVEYIYTLILENGKYYVGKSRDVALRVRQHMDGEGANWTKVHKYKGLLSVERVTFAFQEDVRTKELMKKYGIENVRGGTYCSIVLDESTVNFLKRELTHERGDCFQCGEPGHYAKNCPSRNSRPTKGCDRCGRHNHTRKNCYAKRHVNGSDLEPELLVIPFCVRCQTRGHFVSKCPEKEICEPNLSRFRIVTESSQSSEETEEVDHLAENYPFCVHCRTQGHFVDTCPEKESWRTETKKELWRTECKSSVESSRSSEETEEGSSTESYLCIGSRECTGYPWSARVGVRCETPVSQKDTYCDYCRECLLLNNREQERPIPTKVHLCGRCQRAGHFMSFCTAQTHADGNWLCSGTLKDDNPCRMRVFRRGLCEYCQYLDSFWIVVFFFSLV